MYLMARFSLGHKMPLGFNGRMYFGHWGGGHSHHVHVQPRRVVHTIQTQHSGHFWRKFILALLVVSAIIAVWQWLLLAFAVAFLIFALVRWGQRR